ncbi:MAG: cellulase family glycosylhydrolase [Chloroflexi bacterium]|nr:cellulase family glycosylhydrolase [Chloroflexota bacterium]
MSGPQTRPNAPSQGSGKLPESLSPIANTPTAGPFFFGLHGGYQNAEALRKASEAGAGSIRIYVEWAQLQHNEAYNTNNWLEPTALARLDGYIKNATAAGLRPILLIGEAPDYAAARPRGPLLPGKQEHFNRFVETLVTTYKAPPYNVKLWELWPEPDAVGNQRDARRGAWGDNGAEFASMLKSTYPVIKRADPEATVFIGALALDWFADPGPGFNGGGIFRYTFVDDVLKNGGAAGFDVFAFNSYAAFAPGWEERAAGRDIAAKTNWVRAKLGEHGVSKPIMVLESGIWSAGQTVAVSGPGGQGLIDVPPSPEWQAAYVPRLFSRGLAAGLLGVSWYTLLDGEVNPIKYGLLAPNLTPKPAYTALSVTAQKLRGSRFAGPPVGVIVAAGDVEGYRFDKAGTMVTALWALGGADATAMVRVPESVRVVDALGRPVTPQNGEIKLTALAVFLEE